MPLRFSVVPWLIACGCLCLSSRGLGSELKYLPRLGTTPLLFLAPSIPVVPAPLPPLDMGGENEDDAPTGDDPDVDGEREKNNPERRTRSMSVSSRDTDQRNAVVQGQGEGLENGGAPNGGAGVLGSPQSMVDPNSLLPDGFQLEPDGLPGDRQDLRVFLNYFVGPRKGGQPQGPSSDEKNPKN